MMPHHFGAVCKGHAAESSLMLTSEQECKYLHTAHFTSFHTEAWTSICEGKPAVFEHLVKRLQMTGTVYSHAQALRQCCFCKAQMLLSSGIALAVS